MSLEMFTNNTVFFPFHLTLEFAAIHRGLSKPLYVPLSDTCVLHKQTHTTQRSAEQLQGNVSPWFTLTVLSYVHVLMRAGREPV